MDATTNSSDADHDSVFAEPIVFNERELAASVAVECCNSSSIITSAASGYYQHDSKQQHKQSSTPHVHINAKSNGATGSGNNKDATRAPATTGLLQSSVFDVRTTTIANGCDGNVRLGVNMGNIQHHYNSEQYQEQQQHQQLQQFGQNHKQDSGNYLDYSNENVNEYDNNYFETIIQQHENQWCQEHYQQQYQELENQLFGSLSYNDEHSNQTILPQEYKFQHSSTENSALIDNSCSSANELQIHRDYQPSLLDIVSNPGQVDYNDGIATTSVHNDENLTMDQQRRVFWPPRHPQPVKPPNDNHPHEDNAGNSGLNITTNSLWHLTSPAPSPKVPITMTAIAERPYSICEVDSAVVSELSATVGDSDSNIKTKIDLRNSGGDHDKNIRTQTSDTLKINHKLKGELTRLTVVATLGFFSSMFLSFFCLSYDKSHACICATGVYY